MLYVFVHKYLVNFPYTVVLVSPEVMEVALSTGKVLRLRCAAHILAVLQGGVDLLDFPLPFNFLFYCLTFPIHAFGIRWESVFVSAVAS